jgi:DNA repair exonuclease SbcCD ATPase subunit
VCVGLAGSLIVAGCGGGASDEQANALEARVAELEQQVQTLSEETKSLRALEGRLDDAQAVIDDAISRLGGLEGFVDDARERLNQLDEVRDLIERLADLAGGG